ncbi:S53 family peptidase [Undibacterium terreum]|nr:S53 family peptidase [Undibacterium terreum]
MKKAPAPFTTPRHAGLLLSVCATAILSACGGGTDTADTALSREQVQAQAAVATGISTFQLTEGTLPEAAAQQLAVPAFHLAPVLLDTPDNGDADGRQASSRRAARMQSIPSNLRSISSRRLSVRQLKAAEGVEDNGTENTSSTGNAAGNSGGGGNEAAPMASGVVSTYTPAQIRAAYGLPTLPALGAAMTAAQAAQLGAGQTIYIIDAKHNPNTVAELAAFNQKFGLPGCTLKAISPTASLPLAAASSSACELSIVYNTTSGTMTSTQPAYDSGWATEITLDVQWAHATAPLARIVVIEANDASLNSLAGGVKLANAMGPGVVSMSFGSQEGSYTASVDSAFTAPNMTYLAATGDSGAAVSWPAVSTNVVAVGGTSLTYSGSGTRSETGWVNTGGGISAYTAAPAYQNSTVPGMGSVSKRNVADVSFNADPNTGQYLAVISSGSSTVSWLSAGGTSLSTPQWAGLIAIANANRALNAKAALGAPHAVLYSQIASVPGTYASVFADVTKGSDGTCSACTAKSGYDILTGLGTPNVSSLLNSLSGATVTAAAPVVVPASISGQAGTALSFTVSVTAPNSVTYSLSGAPSGMAISSAGAVTWAAPVAGTYAVTVTAKDSKTGLTGQGVYTVTIAALSAPVVNGGSVSGKAGTALSFAVSVTNANPVTYTLGSAPAGMTISSSGIVSWASPVAGTYAVTVVAKDSKTAKTGQGTYTVTIAGATTSGITITAPAMTGVAGKALKGTIAVADPGASSVSISVSGIPMGMTFTPSGLTMTANWASPVTGTYSLKVSVTDSAGRSAQATVPVTITAK